MVIYVDVLFIINFFISYMLLGICAKLSKINIKVSRLMFASFIGGLYSLIILVDNLSPIIVAISKILVVVIMLLIAFKYSRVMLFLKLLFIYAFTNLLFLGVIVGVCLIFNPTNVAVKNSVVYFDLSAKTLIGCALLAYLLACIVIRLYNRKLLTKEIYTITVFANEQQATLYAFLDTGNHLREPFSNYPVIIAKKDKLIGFTNEKNIRLIPTTTVNSTKLLTAFKADKIIIKSPTLSEEVVENVYVALSDNIKSDTYSAILNADILHI